MLFFIIYGSRLKMIFEAIIQIENDIRKADKVTEDIVT
jgi:hypothetical protein